MSSADEDILIRILSYLPTTFAVESSLKDRPSEAEEFMNLMDRMLEHRQKILKKLYLRCNEHLDHTRVERWISTLMQDNHKIEDVILKTVIRAKPISLPDSLFKFRSLTRLDLHVRSYIDLSEPIDLPNLQICWLARIVFTCKVENSCPTLFACCLALKELTLTCCHWEKMRTVWINAAELKCLVIDGEKRSEYASFQHIYDKVDDVALHFPSRGDIADGIEDEMEDVDMGCGLDRCVLRISAAKLVKFRYIEEAADDYVLDVCKSLDDVDIGCLSHGVPNEEKMANGAWKLLEWAKTVKRLVVSDKTLEALSCLEDLQLEMFFELTHLEVNTFYNGKVGKPLSELLQKAPNLKSVVFAEAIFQHRDGDYPPWTTTTVPECVSKALRSVEFNHFSMDKFAQYVVELFLKDANSLERMTIRYTPSSLPSSAELDGAGLLDKFKRKLASQRGSKPCRIDFKEEIQNYSR
ncbi:hypothetical protein BVC80_525g8 [Macleaya cordata]|uniref:F-box/LRR-repeat protein 15/At3g58940/PEG3-like LRR domain-containing protein n=1 Tax=Macleaya cordata TaxID=56857 RepID=A0A200R902_MACCD|nr:hypothetical protein BVC80_525g8 [Macleaya cordata]